MHSQVIEITTEEMLSGTKNPEVLIVDIRPISAYNGWKLQEEKRGGHIRGSRSFPYEWTRYEFELQELFLEKGILPDRSIILYGNSAKETLNMAKLLLDAGYRKVAVYNRFLDEWSIDPELPMDHLENYQSLVYPEWVMELTKGHNPPGYRNKRFVICHSHYGKREDYEQGHVPGAIDLDTLGLESADTWNRRSGIAHDTTVILYGRFSFPDMGDPFPGQSAGHLGAIRCAFIMLYAGVKDVRILNGGISAWESAGYEISRSETKPDPIGEFGASIPGRPELVVDIPQAKELLASADGELVCVRSWPEFIGEVSGYHYIEKKGRIPGAIFGNCGSDAYHMENYRNLDHTMRDFSEIKALWINEGIVPEKHIAFYCGTGWRGSEAFFNAWLMGWPRVSVFDGGWYEWSNDPNNPIETGIPKS